MATLSAPHWETVNPAMREVLQWIGGRPFARRFYLAGGTALALRLGHRRSFDLDFFSETDDLADKSREEILAAIASRQPQVIENVAGGMLIIVSGVRVSFSSYGYRLLQTPETLEDVLIASLIDIGLMKLDALVSRGSRKDFYDTYFIAHQIPIADLLGAAPTKYPRARDYSIMAIEGMVQFDNAERDFQPELLVDLPWEHVRQFFVEQARALGQSWFGNS
jgi:hypothetical protein